MSKEEGYKRIVDEYLKHASHNKINIEDVNKRTEIRAELVTKMIKDTLHQLSENVFQEATWAMSNGARPPDPSKVMFQIQSLLMVYLQGLLDAWHTCSHEALADTQLAQFKDVLDKFGAPK